MPKRKRGQTQPNHRTKADIIIEIVKHYPEGLEQDEIREWLRQNRAIINKKSTIDPINNLIEMGLVQRKLRPGKCTILTPNRPDENYPEILEFVVNNADSHVYDFLLSEYHIEHFFDFLQAYYSSELSVVLDYGTDDPEKIKECKEREKKYYREDTREFLLMTSPHFIRTILSKDTMKRRVEAIRIVGLMAQYGYAYLSEIEPPEGVEYGSFECMYVDVSLVEDYIEYGDDVFRAWNISGEIYDEKHNRFLAGAGLSSKFKAGMKKIVGNEPD